VKPSSFIDQLFDIHRDLNALADAARHNTGLGSLGNSFCRIQLEMDLGNYKLDRWFEAGTIHTVLLENENSTALVASEVEGKRDNLVAKTGGFGS
jgi:hypothetical protein